MHSHVHFESEPLPLASFERLLRLLFSNPVETAQEEAA